VNLLLTISKTANALNAVGGINFAIGCGSAVSASKHLRQHHVPDRGPNTPLGRGSCLAALSRSVSKIRVTRSMPALSATADTTPPSSTTTGTLPPVSRTSSGLAQDIRLRVTGTSPAPITGITRNRLRYVCPNRHPVCEHCRQRQRGGERGSETAPTLPPMLAAVSRMRSRWLPTGALPGTSISTLVRCIREKGWRFSPTLRAHLQPTRPPGRDVSVRSAGITKISSVECGLLVCATSSDLKPVELIQD